MIRKGPLERFSSDDPTHRRTDAPISLDNVLVKFFQVVTHCNHELVGFSAIDDAMIVAQDQTNDMADSNRVVAMLIRYDYRLLEDPTHPQDGDLRLKNDWRAELWPENSRIGNGDGATLDFIGNQLLGPRSLAQIGHGTLQPDKTQVLRAL